MFCFPYFFPSPGLEYAEYRLRSLFLGLLRDYSHTFSSTRSIVDKECIGTDVVVPRGTKVSSDKRQQIIESLDESTLNHLIRQADCRLLTVF